MPADVAAALLTVLYVVPGLALLWGADLLQPTPTGALAAAGLGYICGLAAVLTTGVVLLCAGIPVTIPTLVVVAAVLTAAGVLAALRAGRRPPWPPPRVVVPSPRTWSVERWIVTTTLAALAAYFVVGYNSAVLQPLSAWDSWSIWARKAILLTQTGTLPTSFLTASDYGFMHQDYPMLFPLLESVWFRVVGSPDTQSIHGHLWILLIAAVWAAGYLASRVARPVLWAPVIALLAVTPGVNRQLMTAYADVPMAIFLALGALAAGRWLHERRTADLGLAVLLLAAAANTKNEGLVSAFVVLVACLVVAGRPRRPVLVAGGALLLTVMPWHLWIGAHHITGDMPLSKGLSPGYLLGRTERVWPSVKAIATQVTDQGTWDYVLPLAIALVVGCLVTGVARRAAGLYALAGVGCFLAVVWAYWISPNEIGWHLSTSVDRTVDGVLFLSVAAVLHLGGRLLPALVRAPRPSPARQPATQQRPQHAEAVGSR